MTVFRLLDFFLATIILMFSLPVFLVVALILLFDRDPGGIFFMQKRIGKNLDVFKIIKFRSMRSDQKRNIGSLSKESENLSLEEKKKLRKKFETTKSNDPRITPIGKILRKTSIDELPQLINVIKGEMSLVGPRPDTPVQEVDYLPNEWTERHKVRPGITGISQVNGRSNSTYDQRINGDLFWVRNQSTKLYFSTLLKTAITLTKGTN